MVLRLSLAGAVRAAALTLLIAATPPLAATPVLPTPALDALPSWKEGPTKQALLAFVERVSRPGSPDCVPPAERIATFGLLVHHTDARRKYAYDVHPTSTGRLVVDMARDWSVLFRSP